MSIQKKSLIGNLKTAQKAIVAAIDATKPLQPVAGQPGLVSAKRETVKMAKHGTLTMAKHGTLTMAKQGKLAMAKRGKQLATAKAGNQLTMAKAADFIAKR